MRNMIKNEASIGGDPVKAVVRVVEFVDAIENSTKDESVPFRWMMGMDCIQSLKPQFTSLNEDVVKSEKWSVNLTRDV